MADLQNIVKSDKIYEKIFKKYFKVVQKCTVLHILHCFNIMV